MHLRAEQAQPWLLQLPLLLSVQAPGDQAHADWREHQLRGALAPKQIVVAAAVFVVVAAVFVVVADTVGTAAAADIVADIADTAAVDIVGILDTAAADTADTSAGFVARSLRYLHRNSISIR